MLVNLTDVFTTEGKESTYEYTIDDNQLVIDSQVYTLKENLPIAIVVRQIEKNQATVEGEVSLLVHMNCDRCLEEVEKQVKFSFFRKVNSPECSMLESMEEEMDPEDNYMEGYSLNIARLIHNEILINWPTKVLCKETCKGICKSCGQDLNKGTCSCDTFVPDPRMAGIKDIFNGNKEV